MKVNIWWQRCALSSGLIVLFCCPPRRSRLTHYSGHYCSRYYDEVHESSLDRVTTEKMLNTSTSAVKNAAIVNNTNSTFDDECKIIL